MKRLTTTTSFSPLAVSTRRICPACKAPIVGTRPLALPAAAPRRDAPRIAAGCSITVRPLSAVPDLFGPHELGGFAESSRGPLSPVLCGRRSVGRVLVLRPRELPCAHVFRIRRRRARDLLCEVRVSLDELRRLAGGQAEQVVQDQDLPVGARTRADADGRDAELVGNGRGELARQAAEGDAA